MKKLIFISVLFFSLSGIDAQPCLDLGIKGGTTISELSFNDSWDYIRKNKLSYHLGAFSRIGWGRLFVQPEVYFNSRGGNLNSADDLSHTAIANFDFASVDVPVLAGIKLVKLEYFNFRVMGGPVLGFMTSRDVEPGPDLETFFSKDYFKDHFYGWQLGTGIDLRWLTLDVRYERSRNSVYQSSDFTTRNNLVLVSLGLKIF